MSGSIGEDVPDEECMTIPLLSSVPWSGFMYSREKNYE